MAERRMFTKKVTDDDNFMSLSASAQALYLHLSMSADDDGFCNQVSISMFKAHASVQDLQALLEKRYIYQFENGVIVIKHWRMANALRKDRYTPTAFQEELRQLEIKDNGAYTMPYDSMVADWLPSGCQSVAECLPQDRLGKDRLDKDRLDMNIKDVRPSDEGQRTSSDIKSVISAWNELPITKVQAINPGTKRYKMLKARISEYGIDAVLEAINLVSQSPFLLGRKTDFVITFDWFVRPNNFIKVYEGNYNEQFRKTKHDALEDFMEGGNNDKTGIW